MSIIVYQSKVIYKMYIIVLIDDNNKTLVIPLLRKKSSHRIIVSDLVMKIHDCNISIIHVEYFINFLVFYIL